MNIAAAVIVGVFLGALAVLVILRHRDAPLSEALTRARADYDMERLRVDRLTEALAHQANVPLILPQSQPMKLEPSPGWWDVKKVDTTTNNAENVIFK